MDLKLLLTVCLTVFVAELGDKTQFATMSFAANREVSGWVVFAGASLGLVMAAGIGVVAGQFLAQFLSPKILTWIAGIIFVVLGSLTLFKAMQMQ